ncbi:hypothetical protein AWL63_18345 [Sphingomonas panacis]|uniref:Uncharacterized protein n=1 Tax=Sphingomonas panacis TaxID=1560345 RepID=A0A1B3ZDU9_9SPHN|nr:hypothetical protein [Sphingomonas panacis]AOH85604.1 hypothetical protein AWL63_18345 [Sphingomonas panacis]
MTKTAQSIYDDAPLGARIRYSDGTPRPPERFTRKVRAWESRNGGGRLTQLSPAGTGSHPYPATFTLHEADYGSEDVIVLSVNKMFAVTDQRVFEIVDVPPPGAALVLQEWNDQRELLHVAADRAAAESWLDRHGYSRALVEIVGEAETAIKAA